MKEENRVKILSVADTVCPALLDPMGGGPPAGDIDLILGCGDLPPEYLASLRHRYDAPLLYVLGNHDLRYSQTPPMGCEPLHQRLVVKNGVRIIGFNGSRWYNGGVNQYIEKQMAGFIRRMRFRIWRHGGVDLVVTHAPPRFIGDAEDPCHRGFRVFLNLIDRYQPRIFIHGHIHALFKEDSERITKIHSTAVVNSYGFYVFKI
jgi:Icc-related predicted phosphoesterase